MRWPKVFQFAACAALVVTGAAFLFSLRETQEFQEFSGDATAALAPKIAVPEMERDADTVHVVEVVVRVIDGDTVELSDGERVRLIGIDAPERGVCFFDGSANALRTLAEGKSLRAERDVSERDRYGRLLFYLYDSETFVNLAMVEQGAATAFPYSPDTQHAAAFEAAEARARGASFGMWSACNTIASAPSAAPDVLDVTAPGSCMIKGNIASSGERIYHLPGCGSYEKTAIDEAKGERWFCSEVEATAAGWRKAKNCP